MVLVAVEAREAAAVVVAVEAAAAAAAAVAVEAAAVAVVVAADVEMAAVPRGCAGGGEQ